MSKYKIHKRVPVSGKTYAEYLARLLSGYVKNREREILRHLKALKKINTEIESLEKEIQDMGDDVFEEDLKL